MNIFKTAEKSLENNSTENTIILRSFSKKTFEVSYSVCTLTQREKTYKPNFCAENWYQKMELFRERRKIITLKKIISLFNNNLIELRTVEETTFAKKIK